MRYLIALSLMAIGSTARAAAEDSTEDVFFAPIPMVLSASRLTQSTFDTPASVTVLDRRIIDASSAIEVADLLRLVPGFQVAHANGSIFTVTYHGNADEWSNRMQVLVDGRSVYTPLYSIVEWTHLGITLDDIARIEVIRGPNVPAYGANAFLGTINIVTKQAFEDPGFGVRYTNGSLNTDDAVMRFASATKDLDYRATVSFRRDDGFDNVDDHKVLRGLSVRGTYTATVTDSMDLQFGTTDGTSGAWGSPDYVFFKEHDKKSRSYFGLGRWNHVFAPNRELQVQLYHNYLSWDDTFEALIPSAYQALFASVLGNSDTSFLLSRYDGVAKRSDLEIQFINTFNSDARIVWGASVRLDQLQSDQILNQAAPLTDHSQRVFGHGEWRASPALLFNLGMMVEDNDISDRYVSPRLGANYRLGPNQMIRASVTRAQRTPSIYENFEYNDWTYNDGTQIDLEFVSRGNLRPEQIRSFEIGYLRNAFDDTLALDLKLFREETTDIIDHPRDITYPDAMTSLLSTACTLGLTQFCFSQNPSQYGAFVRMNSGSLNTVGFEFSVKYTPSLKDLLLFNYGYASAEGSLIRQVDGATILGTHPNFGQVVPRHTVSALVSHALTATTTASVSYFYVAPMEWRGEGNEIDKYNRTDLRVSTALKRFGHDSHVAVIAQNVMGEYVEFRSRGQLNLFEPRLYIQLSLNY